MRRIALVLALVSSDVAHAQSDEERVERVVAEALVVAQVCFLEAGWREADCRAMASVARKRAAIDGRHWLVMLRDYSALDVKWKARPRAVRQFVWGDVAGHSQRWNDRWARLRALALRIVQRDYDDPCPSAMHWGGTMDPPRRGMIRARCARPTANTFYAVSR